MPQVSAVTVVLVDMYLSASSPTDWKGITKNSEVVQRGNEASFWARGKYIEASPCGNLGLTSRNGLFPPSNGDSIRSNECMCSTLIVFGRKRPPKATVRMLASRMQKIKNANRKWVLLMALNKRKCGGALS